jgi:hypothetical protein
MSRNQKTTMMRINGRKETRPDGRANGAARSNVVNTQSFWAGMRKTKLHAACIKKF